MITTTTRRKRRRSKQIPVLFVINKKKNK